MSKYIKQVNKHYKLITKISSLVIMILGVVVYIALVPLFGNVAVNNIKSSWFDTNTLAKNRNAFPTKVFEDDVLVKDYEYKFVRTRFDIFKPTYTYLGRLKTQGDLPKEQTYIQFRVIYLERNSLNTWKVVDFRDGDMKQNTLQEATNLASKYDITTDFPGKDKYNITNYPPLTPQEIENNKRVREESLLIEERKNNPTTEYDTKLKVLTDQVGTVISPTERVKSLKSFYEPVNKAFSEYKTKLTQRNEDYSKIVFSGGTVTVNEPVIVEVYGVKFSGDPKAGARSTEELEAVIRYLPKEIESLEKCTEIEARNCELDLIN
jgi:hypothetical protein